MIKSHNSETIAKQFAIVGCVAILVQALVLTVLAGPVSVRPIYANTFAVTLASAVFYFCAYKYQLIGSKKHPALLSRLLPIVLIAIVTNFLVFMVSTEVFSNPYWVAFIVSVVAVPFFICGISEQNIFSDTADELRPRRMVNWLPAALCFVVTSVLALSLHIRVPIFDHWDLLPFYNASDNGALSLERLTHLHGSHWHASSYILLVGVAKLTNMAHWAEISLNLLFALLTYLALARIIKRQTTVTHANRLLPLALAMCAVFVFSLDQAENWLMGWQLAVFVHIAGVAWFIESLTRGSTKISSTGLAIFSASVAIFAFGTGWALLPIGFVLLLVFGGHKTIQGRISLVLWLLFCIAIFAYLKYVSSSTENTYLQTVWPDGGFLANLGPLLLYAVKYVASPLTRFSSEIAVPVFMLGGGFCLWSLLTLRKNNRNWIVLSAPFIALTAYGFGAGLLTGLGRLQEFGSDSAFLSRYISFSNLFWIGVFGLIFCALSYASGKARKAAIGFLVTIVILKIATMGNVLQRSVPNAIALKAAAQNMQACYPDISADTRRRIAVPRQNMDRQAVILKQKQLSVFRKKSPQDTVNCSTE